MMAQLTDCPNVILTLEASHVEDFGPIPAGYYVAYDETGGIIAASPNEEFVRAAYFKYVRILEQGAPL